MHNLTNEKGITMVTLIVTIVVLLILSSVGVNIGINGINSVNDSKLNSELQMVQHAVLEQYIKFTTTKDNFYLVGNKISYEEAKQYANELGVELVNIPNNYNNKDYYKLDKASLVTIGIKDSSDEYIINYISGEVMNITVKKSSKNEPLYIKANDF